MIENQGYCFLGGMNLFWWVIITAFLVATEAWSFMARKTKWSTKKELHYSVKARF